MHRKFSASSPEALLRKCISNHNFKEQIRKYASNITEGIIDVDIKFLSTIYSLLPNCRGQGVIKGSTSKRLFALGGSKLGLNCLFWHKAIFL